MSTVKFAPMLACDYDRFTVEKHFPILVQPKIDGVRGINVAGNLVGRSLKPFRNTRVTNDFSNTEFDGFDGEMWVTFGSDRYVLPTSASLCRNTTSVLNSKAHESGAFVHWTVFDYITDETKHLPYKDRFLALHWYLEHLYDIHKYDDFHPVHRIYIIDCSLVGSLDTLDSYHADHLEDGYEGTIIRQILALYKQGKSTNKEGGLMRVKDFQDAEAVVLKINQGKINHNQAKTNELGHTERSTHKVNMLDSGQVGSLECRSLVDGSVITVGPGCMDHDERVHYWNHQEELLGKTIKFKFFPHGQKNKPRFPTYVCLRIDEDLVVYS